MILVAGQSGMLGHMIFKILDMYFEDVVGTTRSGSNNTIKCDSKRIPYLIRELKPKWIVNCIGCIKQKTWESEEMVYNNSLLPHLLVEEVRAYGGKVINFSTDCIFSGNKGNYTLEDIPDATDLYGISKAAGEKNLGITIRSSIIGWELSEEKNSFLEWAANAKEKVQGYTGAIYTGITTLEMAQLVKACIQSDVESRLYQIASNKITKYDLIKLIMKNLNLNYELIENNVFKCDRSLVNYSTLTELTGYKVPSWERMIEEICLIKNQY